MNIILMRVFKLLIFNKNATSTLGKWLYTAYSKKKELQKKYRAIRSIYTLVMNPNNWKQALLKLSKKDFSDLLKELTKMEKETRDKQVFKTDNEQVNKKMDELNKEFKGEGKWVTLSSSWLKSGKFQMMGKNKLVGTLYLQTKKSTTVYAYPMVSYNVWFLMKNANGSNGGGAGTVFWKYWLHMWLPSALRKKVYEDYKYHNITKEEAEQVFHEQTNTTARNYSRSAQSKLNDPLNRFLDQQGGKGFVTNTRRSAREYYKETSKYMSYVQETTKWRKYGEFGDRVADMQAKAKKIRKTERNIKHAMHPFKYAEHKGYTSLRRDIRKGQKANG